MADVETIKQAIIPAAVEIVKATIVAVNEENSHWHGSTIMLQPNY